nr:MAG TPA: hypothetical protein [Caudoviricetes sp.]
MNLELWKKIKKEKKLTIEQIAKAANLPKGSVQNNEFRIMEKNQERKEIDH